SVESKPSGGASRPLARGWSMYYTTCRECGTTERRHIARGLCGRCYESLAKRGLLPAKEERAWSPWAPSCRRCGTTDRKHGGKGLCMSCYMEDYSALPEVIQARRLKNRTYYGTPAFIRSQNGDDLQEARRSDRGERDRFGTRTRRCCANPIAVEAAI